MAIRLPSKKRHREATVRFDGKSLSFSILPPRATRLPSRSDSATPRFDIQLGGLEFHSARQEHGPLAWREPQCAWPSFHRSSPSHQLGLASRRQSGLADSRSGIHELDESSPRGTANGAIGSISVSQHVDLGAGETKVVSFSPGDFPQLTIQNPRLWWPAQMGTPNLYHLSDSFHADGQPNGQISDEKQIDFGIRESTRT